MPSNVVQAGCGHFVYIDSNEKPPFMCEVCDKEIEEALDVYEEKVARKNGIQKLESEALQKVRLQIEEGGIRQIF